LNRLPDVATISLAMNNAGQPKGRLHGMVVPGVGLYHPVEKI